MAHTHRDDNPPHFGQRFAQPTSTVDRAARRAALATALDACRVERATAGDSFLDWEELGAEIAQRRGGSGGEDR